MTLTFFDLGADIIESDIIPYLSPADIRSLKLASKSLYQLVDQSSFIWHELFKKTFGTKPTAFSMNKWPELYSIRAKGRFYSWGAMGGGRLGLSSKDVPTENLERQGFSSGVCKPTKVPGIEEILADVSAGGFSFQILTAHGEIYSSGSYHAGHQTGPGPDQSDYNEFQQQIRHQESVLFNPLNMSQRMNPVLPIRLGGVRHRPMNEEHPHPLPGSFPSSPYQIPQDDTPKPKSKVENRFLVKERAQFDTQFVSVSSGRAHFIAMDNTGNLWSWDRGDYGVKLKFVNQGGVDLKSQGRFVLKALAGWDSSVAYIYNYGLVYWKKHEPLKKDQTEAKAHHVLIPNTGDINGPGKIVDFVAGEDFIIYVTLEGKIYRNDMIGEPSFPLVKFQDYLKLNGKSLAPKFVRLSGSFRSFTAFSNEDLVLLGSKNTDEPEIIDELQKVNCISVAVGDYHFLALLRDGTMLSWGLESNHCGCLGLGKQPNGSIIEGGSKRVIKPTQIDAEGKVVAIAAAGWQSAAIISDS